MKKQLNVNYGRSIANPIISCALIAILPAFTLNASPAPQVGPDSSSTATDQKTESLKRDKPLVKLVSPSSGASFQSKSVAVILDISPKANRRSIQVLLNNKNVTDSFRDAGPCLGVKTCTETGAFTLKDGLKNGTNQLSVRVQEVKSGKGGNSRTEITRLSFTWQPSKSVDLTDPKAIELTPSVGFTTLAPGGQQNGQPWIQIYSNSINGGTVTYPSLINDKTCTTTYQVLELDRKSLKEVSYSCYDDDASLTAALKQLAPAVTTPPTPGNLVIVGTTWYHNAGPALDTSSIGGTAYAGGNTRAFFYPLGYMAVGVAGASAGQVHESFYVSQDGSNNTGQYNPALNGVLSQDSNGYYSYYPSDNRPYSVDATHSIININGVKYTPPTGATSGFWLLALHRITLQNEHGCTTSDHGLTYPNCGKYYDTNTSDGMASLVSDLNSWNPRDLVFLVAVGSPFLSTLPPTQDLVNAIETLGGSGYTLDKLISAPSPAFTLVSSPDPGYNKSFPLGNAVVSSNVATNQHQTGSVLGVLVQNLHNIYLPATTTQTAISNSSPVDTSFYRLAWTQPAAWPLTDTSGHLGAYRYLSYAVKQKVSTNNTVIDDIRAQYPSPAGAPDFVGVDTTTLPYPSQPWLDPVNSVSYSFTTNDMSDVAKQLNTEFLDLKTINNYVSGNPSLRSALFGDSGGVALALMNAATTAADDLGAQTNSTGVSLNWSNAENLLGAFASLGALFLDPEDLPILGFASGALWAAGSSSILNSANGGVPSPYLTVTQDVATLSAQASNYRDQLQKAFDQSLNNVYTDWSKLSVVAANTGIGGSWYVTTDAPFTNIQSAFKASSLTYFYVQILSSLYGLDTFAGMPKNIDKPWLIGSAQLQGTCNYGCYYWCTALYKNPLPSGDNGYAVFPNPGSYSAAGLNDIFVIGGPISNNNSSDMKEKLPSSAYMDQLFGTDPTATPTQLNLGSDLFFSPNGPLQRRVPNFYGGYFCYNIGGNVHPH